MDAILTSHFGRSIPPFEDGVFPGEAILAHLPGTFPCPDRITVNRQLQENRVKQSRPRFVRPGLVDRTINRLFGLLVRWGLGLRDNYLLQVQGRTSGRMYSTPVNVLEISTRRFLVAPRGETQWVRNARVSGQVRADRPFPRDF